MRVEYISDDDRSILSDWLNVEGPLDPKQINLPKPTMQEALSGDEDKLTGQPSPTSRRKLLVSGITLVGAAALLAVAASKKQR